MKKFLRLSALLIVLALSLSLIFVACQKPTSDPEDPVPTVADNTEHFDKITKTLKLSRSYEGKVFTVDGIEKVTVAKFTDGDTTTFSTSTGNWAIRYHSVNTPESTGQVEKWGKAASNFTKNRLTDSEIVIESHTGGAPEKDSYGSRYLGYVWYRKSSNEDFKCLNLELVENGFSDNKGNNTSTFPYNSFFAKAEEFAHSIQLRMWSTLDDPLYTDDPVAMTIKEFWDNPDAFYTKYNDDGEEINAGAKIVMYAYLKSYSIYRGTTGSTVTYVAEQYDPETGETHQINVYADYVGKPSSRMELGHLYRIIGTIQEWSNSFQISGIMFGATGKGYSKVSSSNYYMTFDSSKAEDYDARYGSSYYGDLTVTSVSLEGTTLTIEAKACRITSTSGVDVSTEKTFTIKVEVTAGYDGIHEGDTLALTGYQFTEYSNVINVVSMSNISINPSR